MDDLWRNILLRKYGNLIDLLETYTRDCPPELWEESIWPVSKDQPWVWPIKRFGEKAYPGEAAQLALLPTISAYWNVMYHAVFHIDFYLSGGGLPYKPPKPFREEEHRPSTVPARTYTPDELLAYLAHCGSKAKQVIGGLTDEAASAITPRNGGTFLDLLFHNLLHAYEHAGQFGLFLGQHGVVSSAGTPAHQLRTGVRGKDDCELDAFVASIGGYKRLLPQVFAGFAATIKSPAEGTMLWDTGTRTAIRFGPKGGKVEKKLPASADVIIRLSPQDFLRVMTRDLDFQAGVAAGRIVVEGDASLLAAALADGRPVAEPETAFAHWLDSRGIEGFRRIVRKSGDAILVSKFESGFAARLYEALDRVPELFDEAEVRRRYAALPPETNRVEAWRLAINALLSDLGPPRGLDPDQLAEIRAGTDSVAALLDACLWTAPTVAGDWQPSAAEREAYSDAVARMADESSIFTRYYGDFEGKRVENHCPGAPVARRLFAQAWAVVGADSRFTLYDSRLG